MEINFKYLCVATDNRATVKLFLNSNNDHISIPILGKVSSGEEVHERFLALIGFDPKFLKPVLLDVLIEEDNFNIYYGVLFPLDLEVKVEGFSFKDAKPLDLNPTQLRLLYLTMAKGLLP